MDRSDRKMLWLDTDIGTDIDDALTLSYLLGRPDVDLLGISTVTVSAVERAKLAAAICRDMGQPNLRVFAGADRPLIHPHRQTEYPQTEAVDPAMAAEVEEQVARTGAHVEAMYRAALRWPGEVHLLAIGPLTNLALLVRTHPDVADLLAGVTFMAGRFYRPRPAGVERLVRPARGGDRLRIVQEHPRGRAGCDAQDHPARPRRSGRSSAPPARRSAGRSRSSSASRRGRGSACTTRWRPPAWSTTRCCGSSAGTVQVETGRQGRPRA